MPNPLVPLPGDYAEFLQHLKERIGEARVRAASAVNQELVLLYWEIGREILARQARQGWGARVIDRLAADLRSAFPGERGFSPRNLKYMRSFAEAWPDPAIVQQVVAQIPWGHHTVLLDRVKEPAHREWYAREAVRQGWSRNVLAMQIESGLVRRQGRAVTNFERTLAPPQSDLAHELLKDPYTFDFLTLAEEYRERDLERALTMHIRNFLLELGMGFAFVGSQHRLEVGGREFFVDLLFYHLRLRCYVVIELKVGEFEPEFAGKMNFYLAAVDDLLRHPDDGPSIGIILCGGRSDVIVEYALRGAAKPIGVSTFDLGPLLPDTLSGALPSADALSAEVEAFIHTPVPEP